MGILFQGNRVAAPALCELAPFDATEVDVADLDRLWVRGGFPDSFLTSGEDARTCWRVNFVFTCELCVLINATAR